jgi:hypothetical protein
LSEERLSLNRLAVKVSGSAMARPFVHPLAGSVPAALVRTLMRHRGFAPRYAAQIAFMLGGSVLRWPFCLAEAIRTDRRARSASFEPPPVFIVGHWRSGTTLLHNLLAGDPQFCYPTINEALRPYDFYPGPFDFITRSILLRSLPPTRPMDDMPLRPDLPQEDEIALAVMGALSFFNCFYFPADLRETFATEVLFDNASTEQIDHWTRSVRTYLGKIAALYPGRRLLVKNPAHSARIPRLREMFPGAKFIHIIRNPADVATSTRKLYLRMLPVVALQQYDASYIDAHVAWSYPELMRRLQDGLQALPHEDFVEIGYAELVQNPLGVLEAVYDRLRLPRFELAVPSFQQRAQEYGLQAA